MSEQREKADKSHAQGALAVHLAGRIVEMIEGEQLDLHEPVVMEALSIALLAATQHATKSALRD
jgi:hypothetical protein